MQKINLFENTLSKIYIINVLSSLNRHNSSLTQLSKFKINNYEFVKAFTPASSEVRNYYKKSKIKEFPPCFRCGYEICNHKNNTIVPSQVANFLSFKKVMEKIAVHENGLFLILEDDFYFKKNSKHALNFIDKFINNNKLKNIQEPVLLRIGSHKESTKKIKFVYKLFKKLNVKKNSYDMANPAFIINPQFALLFLKNFERIETTSDNFIHKILCKVFNVVNYSFEPFPIGQFSHGIIKNVFFSDIVETKKNENMHSKNKKHFEQKKENWIKLNTSPD